MSPTIGSALPPAASISSAAVNTVPGSRGFGSAVLAISATLAPSRAARRPISRPIPRLPPEMNRVLSLRLICVLRSQPAVGGENRDLAMGGIYGSGFHRRFARSASRVPFVWCVRPWKVARPQTNEPGPAQEGVRCSQTNVLP